LLDPWNGGTEASSLDQLDTSFANDGTAFVMISNNELAQLVAVSEIEIQTSVAMRV
jgi:hypothetical protein